MDVAVAGKNQREAAERKEKNRLAYEKTVDTINNEMMQKDSLVVIELFCPNDVDHSSNQQDKI